MKTLLCTQSIERLGKLIFGTALLTTIPAIAFAASISIDSSKATFTNNVLTVPIAFAAGSDSVSSLNFTLAYDNTRLVLSGVSAGTNAQSASKQVAFHAINSTSAKIIIYGLNTTAMTSGAVASLSFTLAANAPDGDAALTLAAATGATPAANSVTMTTTNGKWTLDKSAPVITLTAPQNGAVFGKSSITVSGSIDDTAVASVKVNGKDVVVSAGKFSTTIALTEGQNTITITALDSQGNQGTSSVTISFKVGDVNEDGIVDSVDIQSALNQFLGKATFSETADTNSDGQINVLDVQKIINRSLSL